MQTLCKNGKLFDMVDKRTSEQLDGLALGEPQTHFDTSIVPYTPQNASCNNKFPTFWVG